MGLQKIESLLDAGELRTLSAGARRLRALGEAWQAVAPPELGASSRVRACKAGTLVIVADNAAVAAKLRQMTGRLVKAIRKSTDRVESIRIEVGIDASSHTSTPAPEKSALGSDAVHEFAALARRVPDGDLRNALDQLVKRHSASSKGRKA